MAKTYYAWSDLYNGGKVGTVKVAGGRDVRNVIKSRNVVRRGESVSQKQLGVSNEEWEALIANGSVRPYPLPEGSSDVVSPATAALRQMLNPRTGELDTDMLLQLALVHPPALNPSAAEEAEALTPEGV